MSVINHNENIIPRILNYLVTIVKLPNLKIHIGGQLITYVYSTGSELFQMFKKNCKKNEQGLTLLSQSKHLAPEKWTKFFSDLRTKS